MAADLYTQNMLARNALIPGYGKQTVRRRQQIFSQTITNYVSGQPTVLNVIPAPAGIITRFLVVVSGSIGIAAAETHTRVQNGAAAILSNVQYTDTSNQQRINCPGWFLNQLSAKKRRAGIWQGVYAMDASGVTGLGSAYAGTIVAAPATLTAAPGAANFQMVYEVPLAYDKTDLTGAVLAAIINATQSLSLTINPNFFVANNDLVNLAEAGYQSSSAQLGEIASLTVKVYQEYIDQFGGLALPTIDLSTQYLLQTSGGWQPTTNTDLAIPYANFRRYLSTVLRYNNNGVFNAGSDINFFSIRTANGTDLEKYDPTIATLLNREWMGVDLPAGYYSFEHRDKPIYTDQYGNVSLVVNPSNVGGAASSILVAYEQLATSTQLVGVGMLSGG